MRATLLCSLAIFMAGALQTLGLSPFNFWPASIISLVTFLFITKALSSNHLLTGKRAFYQGWLFGFGLFASGASWVYVSINTYGHAHPALAGILTLLFVAFLGLFHGAMFYVYAKLKTKQAVLNTLLFAALWTLNDLVRSVFLTGFPWLFVGDTQLHGPLHGYYPVIGSYGITFVLAITSGQALLLFNKPSLRIAGPIAGLLIALWLAPVALNHVTWTKDQNQDINVALLQLNIPQELKWKRAQKPKTVALLEQMSAAQWDKDLIVWPETALPAFYNQAKPLLNKMSKQATANNTSIITGIPYRGWDAEAKRPVMHNSIIGIGDASGIYHKQKLVPFGEHVPLQDILRGLIAFFDLPMSDFRKGKQDQELLRQNGNLTSPFICYEVVYPDFVASRAANADYLITISNDAWFGASIGPHQHLQLAQIRAAENGKYMIRATNNGLTAIIDETGKISASIPQFEQATLEGKVKTFAGSTPFTKLGSLPTLIFCLLTLAISFGIKKRG